MRPDHFPRVLEYTQQYKMCEVHLSLTDSSYLATQPLDDRIFSQDADTAVPKNIHHALVGEWGPAIDRENAGFQQNKCFEPVRLPPGARTLPGI